MKPLVPQKLEFNTKLPHKGQNGRVLVVGGSPPFVGAVYLAAMASLRAGADIVSVAAPKCVGNHINELDPDLITYKFRGSHLSIFSYPKLKRLIEKVDVLLIGNGLGLNPSTRLLVRHLVKNPILKVVDADALKLISLKGLNNAILTPHLGEFAVLAKHTTGMTLSETNPERIAVQAMSLLKLGGKNNVILLKGPIDYIITRHEVLFNTSGNARMRVAGTGDVLAGTIAGVLSQTNHFIKAISIALPALTKTAQTLYEQKGGSYTASELLNGLHKAIFKKTGD